MREVAACCALSHGMSDSLGDIDPARHRVTPQPGERPPAGIEDAADGLPESVALSAVAESYLRAAGPSE